MGSMLMKQLTLLCLIDLAMESRPSVITLKMEKRTCSIVTAF